MIDLVFANIICAGNKFCIVNSIKTRNKTPIVTIHDLEIHIAYIHCTNSISHILLQKVT